MRAIPPHTRPFDGERGFSLIEVMVAGVIAVIAVVGLAYTFSSGRGLIDRYATARDALGVAERRLDLLAMLVVRNPGHADLGIGTHSRNPITLNNNTTGVETWTITWVNDPADNGGGDADPNDYKRVTVEVRWTHGGITDRVQLARTILGF